jgi:glycosyltransferase involved in cell wall biosynthesis
LRKVVFALEGFFPDRAAGTETYVLNLSLALMSSGWDIHIIVPSISDITPYEYSGIQVSRFLIPEKEDVKVLNGLKPPGTIESFMRIVASLKPDIVHFHSFGRAINSFHLEAVKKAGIKTVFTSHLAGIFCLKGNLLYLEKYVCDGKVRKFKCMTCFLAKERHSKSTAWFLSVLVNLMIITGIFRWVNPAMGQVVHKKRELARLKKNADKVISLSKWTEDSYRINGIGNTILIPQAINTHQVERRIVDPVPGEKIRMLFAGRISHIKGLHIVLKALAGDLAYNYELCIAALPDPYELDYYNELEKQTLVLPHSKWIEKAGKEELEKLYASSHLLCVPSLNAEMAPLVILEAQNYGLPVIGSSIGGIIDMVRNKVDGMLFTPGDDQELSKIFRQLAEKPEILRNFSRALESSNSYKEHIQTHIELYQELGVR